MSNSGEFRRAASRQRRTATSQAHDLAQQGGGAVEGVLVGVDVPIEGGRDF